MRDKCDKCGSEILMGECSCGNWYEPNQVTEQMKTLEKALLDFNESGKNIRSGDHHSGSCFIFFRGDYAKVKMIVDFLEGIEKIIHEHPEFKKDMKINFIKDER